MGNTSSSGHMSPLGELCVFQDRTHFTFAEIKRLFNYFKTLKGMNLDTANKDSLLHASIDRETFKTALRVPEDHEHGAKTDALVTRLFEVFDTNASGAVSLEEFIHGLSVCMRGSVQEQTELLFRLFDANRDGEITKLELSALFGFGSDLKPTDDILDRIFKESDKNDDGLLSKEEFRDVVSRHPNLLHFVHLHAFDHAAFFTTTRYLILINGTIESDRAVDFVLRTCAPGDQVHVLYVHPPLGSTARPPHVQEEAWQREDLKRVEKMKGLLEQYGKKIEGTKKVASSSVIISNGEVISKVLEAVDTCDIDVLVVPRHRFTFCGESNKLGPGDLALDLVTHASCSVLVVK